MKSSDTYAYFGEAFPAKYRPEPEPINWWIGLPAVSSPHIQRDEETGQTRVDGCPVTHACRCGDVLFYGVERPDGSIRWLFTRHAAERTVRLGSPETGQKLDLVWRL